MMFGWCAKVRSNGRIPAVLHRVNKSHYADTKARKQHRVAAVLFCNPKHGDTPLNPVLRFKGETRKFRQVNAGQLNEMLLESKSERLVDQWLLGENVSGNNNSKNKKPKSDFVGGHFLLLASVEERFLIETFGSKYEDYQEKVKYRMIPYIFY